MEEGKNIDYKVTIDLTSEKEKVELIKNIIAMANSGGGQIVFGENNETRVGVDDFVVKGLDSAKCGDMLTKFCDSAHLDISHKVESLSKGKYIFILTIPPSIYPIVMTREGTWSGFDPRKGDKPLFRKGDIWTRHSSKTERINNNDVRAWMDKVKTEERQKLLSMISSVTNMPPGSKIEIVSEGGTTIESPKDLLNNACLRRRRDKSHLLGPRDLLWIYQNREQTKFSEEELSILIASALRRNPSLYWWLSILDDSSAVLIDELHYALSGTDRDKSDAARSVIELASIYADERNLRDLLKALRESRYSHFKEQAEEWISRQAMRNQIVEKIKRSRVDKKPLLNFIESDLEDSGTATAKKLLQSPGQGKTSTLAKINRALWFKRKAHLINRY